MLTDIRNYEPGSRESGVTRAWDLTQTRLQCCGLNTDLVLSCSNIAPSHHNAVQVGQPWEMWQYNKVLNPSHEYKLVPPSCCLPDQVDRTNGTDLVAGAAGVRGGESDSGGAGATGGLHAAGTAVRAGPGQDVGGSRLRCHLLHGEH